jgi:sulfide dehydrogenase cytochrome subunit
MKRPFPRAAWCIGPWLGIAIAAQADDFSEALSWNCSGCHGADGVSAGDSVPSIAGMDPRYFFTVMRGFKLDERYSTIMGRIARGYRTSEIRAMARFFSARDWVDAPVSASAQQSDELADAGRAIHDELCAECHEDDGRYQDKEIPRLAGQWPRYLLVQLIDYQQGEVRMPQPDKMRERLSDLDRADLEALSDFYAQVRNGSDGNRPAAVTEAP